MPICVADAPDNLAVLFFSHFPPQISCIRDGEAPGLTRFPEHAKVHGSLIYTSLNECAAVNVV
jgi:hypothetical protein